jgi:carboxylesterase type B
MRKVPISKIENFVGTYHDAGTTPSIRFVPIPDNVTIFANYTDRYRQGKVARAPAIISNAANEGTAFVPYNVNGINQTAAAQATLTIFQCLSAHSSELRESLGLLTYRYQYSGVFPNVSPRPWMLSYHDSDLPMLFGTHPDFRSKSSAFEYEVSHKMQDMLWHLSRIPLVLKRLAGFHARQARR